MKRMVLVLTTVLALIAGTYFADKATRVKPKITMKVDSPAFTAKLAPDFTLKDLGGKDVSLSQYKGQVVLLNFWATWCDPCFIEIPWLIEMQQKYSGKGFTILGVALDEEGKSVVAPWVAKERFNVGGQKLPMNYPILLGDDAVGDKFGGLLGYPTSILISRDGKIIKRVTGILTYDEISKAIESQL
jgi:cytochrome c biogenesis protein CcmG/thiol:disulfide interchange protein DsbE